MMSNSTEDIIIKQAEEAVDQVNELLKLEHKVSGEYPKSTLHQLVKDWYDQAEQDPSEVWWIIQNLKNKRYRQTAISELSRLSGKNISSLELGAQKSASQLVARDGHRPKKSNRHRKKETNTNILVVVGLLVTGVFLISGEPELAAISFGFMCLLYNVTR